MALTLDDLAILANRGVVKRAVREDESGEVFVEIAETDDGEVVARWSDGVECRLLAGKVVSEGRCTCSSTEACRQVVRTVIAYQRQTSAAVDQPPGSWDPGSITDEAIASAFKSLGLTRALEVFDLGLLVELIRSVKPGARFHVPSHTVQFLVPGDVRYTHCDCAEPTPCRHVPLGIWAFRRLEAGLASGFVTTGSPAVSLLRETPNEIESTMIEWPEVGTSGQPRGWSDRLTRLHARCLADDLAWPGEGVDDLARPFERYLSHDALFDPDRVLDLIGEVSIRAEAIRSNTGAVPQVLIRGSASDRSTEVGSARFIGLGCGVRVGRKLVEVASYLQDVATGTVVAVARDFADAPSPSTDSPREFWRLAATQVVKGSCFATLGAGQLMINGGKRSTANRLTVGRGRAVVNPQAFTWEQVRSPVLAEDFDELRARLAMLPPVSLRSRRVAEDFHVVPIAGVESFGFDAMSQAVRASVRDSRGAFAKLWPPSHARGREGVEALLSRLVQQPEALRFVAGRVCSGPRGLVIAPTALVFQDGPTAPREILPPWIDRATASTAGTARLNLPVRSVDPVEDYLRDIRAAMGELFVLGLARAVAQWPPDGAS